MPGVVKFNMRPSSASSTSIPSNHNSTNHGILKKVHCHSCVDHDLTQNHVQHRPLLEYSMPSPVHLASSAHREFIDLTLDDLFYGKEVHIEYTRWTLPNEQEARGIPIYIPPNCPDGAFWRFENAGHQLSVNTYQDMYFQVAVEKDKRGFRREGNDVRRSVRFPWDDLLNTRVCSYTVHGPDGTPYRIEVDYCWTKLPNGSFRVPGKGLPFYEASGRGDLIFDWKIEFPPF